MKEVSYAKHRSAESNSRVNTGKEPVRARLDNVPVEKSSEEFAEMIKMALENATYMVFEA